MKRLRSDILSAQRPRREAVLFLVLVALIFSCGCVQKRAEVVIARGGDIQIARGASTSENEDLRLSAFLSGSSGMIDLHFRIEAKDNPIEITDNEALCWSLSISDENGVKARTNKSYFVNPIVENINKTSVQKKSYAEHGMHIPIGAIPEGFSVGGERSVSAKSWALSSGKTYVATFTLVYSLGKAGEATFREKTISIPIILNVSL